MDQQLRCTYVGHDFQSIIGICTYEQCQADKRILCISCLQTNHAKCQNQFCQTQQFLMKLTALKQKTQQDEDHKLIQLSRQLNKDAQKFIKLLEQFTNDVTLNYGKTNQINRIDQILNKQNILTLQDWELGYKILTDRVEVRTESLIELLNNIKQSINQMAQTQSTISFINLVKSDWNTITRQKPLIIDTKHNVFTIALSPDGRSIASAGYQDIIIKIWDPITGMQVGNGMSGHTECINVINYSKCGNYIVSGGWDKTIRQWNIITQQQIGQAMKHDNYVQGVQYTIDQRYIVSSSLDATVRLWECKTGQEHVGQRIKHVDKIWCSSLSPIQSDIVIGDAIGKIAIWNYEITQQCVFQQGHKGWIASIQYSLDGKLIVSGGIDTIIKLWDAMSKQQIRSYTGHTNSVYSVNFSPDMKYIISGGQDKIVRIWDRTTGLQICDPSKQDFPEGVRSTQFSLDGRYIIIGRIDNLIMIIADPIDY